MLRRNHPSHTRSASANVSLPTKGNCNGWPIASMYESYSLAIYTCSNVEHCCCAYTITIVRLYTYTCCSNVAHALCVHIKAALAGWQNLMDHFQTTHQAATWKHNGPIESLNHTRTRTQHTAAHTAHTPIYTRERAHAPQCGISLAATRSTARPMEPHHFLTSAQHQRPGSVFSPARQQP